ncbi:four helix bundle protein [Nautilia sp. PV-1]|uniref:four helix bundle protein n=1 Tax=Nautilia sp. PV-1 TaxID=2579250 RepID=UPI000FD6C4D4|nr:four helix bundle protein [Nautilia sp. PV-1]AZV47312.1 four helix bundle protein [Nautilia sp. PV-1]
MENGELKTNIIKDKTFELSLKIIKVYKYLNEKKEFVLSKQLLRSGTSIGANVVEALDGISKKDFRNKMSIALKEARETKYWPDLLIASDYLPKQKTEQVLALLEEVTKILVRIVKNAN